MTLTRRYDNFRRRRRSRRARTELTQTLSIASQMALLCPSGMDVWMQRELGGQMGPVSRAK
jgi:hypothetical protein